MNSSGGPYSADDLALVARERLSRSASELPARLVRDYLARVLKEKPGRGRRKPYTDRVLNKLLCLLLVRDRAPRLALPDLGRVINSLPSEQVASLAAGEDLLGVPDVARPDELMRHFRGGTGLQESQAGPADWDPANAPTADAPSTPQAPGNARKETEETLDELFSLLRKDRRPRSQTGAAPGDAAAPTDAPSHTRSVGGHGAAQPGRTGLAQGDELPGPAMRGDWTLVPTRKEIRLEVAGELSIAQQRQLEIIAELIHEIVARSG